MDQEGKGGPQGNDACHDSDFPPFAHHHGPENLAAHLEFQAHGQAFGQIYLGVGRPAHESEEAGKAGVDNDTYADEFKYKDCGIGHQGQESF